MAKMMTRAQQEYRRQNAILSRLSVKYERQLMQAIGGTMTKAAKLIDAGQPYQNVEAEHKAQIESIIYPLYESIITRFADYAREKQKRKVGPKILKRTTVISEFVAQMMAQWAGTYAGELITAITDGTMKSIREVVQQSFIDGVGEVETASRIREVAPEIARYRSRVIARTESHRAANATVFESNKLEGFEQVKIWVSSGGDRTRESHADANGQTRAIDDYFDIGDSKLMYPSDPNGSAKETINCRCVLMYDIV